MENVSEKHLVVIRLGSIEYKISSGKILRANNKFFYEINEPIFNMETQSAYYDSFYYIQNRLSAKDVRKNLQSSYFLIEKLTRAALKTKGYKLSQAEEVKVVYFLYRDLIGLGMLESLYSDPDITFIECKGLGKPVYAYSNEHGWIETNIIFKNPRRLGSLIWRMLKKCTELDVSGTKGTLPDGSFIETDPEFGFQLRKSKPEFTPQFLIKNKMATAAAVAFLDSLIKHNKNILIVGPLTSGKTMFLSGLLHMIPRNRHIGIIETEPKIAINNINWSSTSTLRKDQREAIMNYARARPDYIVLDAVTESTAKFAFNMLSSNHMILTLEAGNTDIAINRLTTRFGVAKSFVANIDAIVMLSPHRDIEEIIEIRNYDKTRNEINAKVVFRKERNKLVPFESKFMHTLGESDKREMQNKARELNLLAKKS